MAANILIDLTGKRFGRYTVVERAPRPETHKQQHAFWKVRCDCGTERVIPGGSLRSGNSRSCGCLCKDINADRLTTHGGRRTREYRIWRAVKDRCFNERNSHFDYYGGRGITMCDRWKNDFTAFLADMGPCPDGLTIERIDVNAHYDPSNCKWATYREQRQNQRRSKFVDYEGQRWNLKELCRHLGVKYNAVYDAVTRIGMTLEAAIVRARQKQ